MAETDMEVCSCIGFWFDSPASDPPSDCTDDDTRAAEVAVDKQTSSDCHVSMRCCNTWSPAEYEIISDTWPTVSQQQNL